MPLSSRTANNRDSGGYGSLCFSSVSTSVTSTAQPVRLSPPSAVVPSETIRSPSRFGLAPAHNGTVSRCVMNSSRGPLRMPGRSTNRFPVCVGAGMRSVTLSKRMAEAGTPTFFSSSQTALPIAFSWPESPSTARKRIKWSSAAFTSTGGLVLLMVLFLSAHEKDGKRLNSALCRAPRYSLQPPRESQQVPYGEEKRPKNDHPYNVRQHQGHDRPDARALVVLLGKRN